MQQFFQKLWSTPILREFALAIVSVLAVQVALGLTDFIHILETSVDPLTDIGAWGAVFVIVLVKEVLKQSAVFGIQKLGRVPSTGVPGTRAVGASDLEGMVTSTEPDTGTLDAENSHPWPEAKGQLGGGSMGPGEHGHGR